MAGVGASSRGGYFGGGLPFADPVERGQIRRWGLPIDDLFTITEHIAFRPYEIASPLSTFVFMEFARATKTARAATLLAANGYGQQSLALARTLYKAMLVIRWAILRPNGADRRVELHMHYARWVEGEAWARSGIAKFDSRPGPVFTAEDRKQAQQWFGKRGTHLWTGHASIKDLVTHLIAAEKESGSSPSTVQQLASSFELMLGWADRMTHSTGVLGDQCVGAPA